MIIKSLILTVGLRHFSCHDLRRPITIEVLRKSSEVYMQKDNSALHRQPKRTARKGVKAGDKSRIKYVSPRISTENDDEATIGEEWTKFCKTEVPELVRNQMRTIKELELELGEDLTFGGPRGSLKGRPGAIEDKRHRAFYGTLSDSEEKMKNFAARQVACRVLGSKDYACVNCWLPLVDCMCGNFERGSLWEGIRLWLYMHPKDFLRKNNTGKVLWQVFGNRSVRLTIFGIQEQEEAMWEVFKQSGRDLVWCVFPEKTPPEYEVVDVPLPDSVMKSEEAGASTIHFVFIDGTWSNSKSMVTRLKDRSASLWGDRGIPCVSLSPTSVSVMHDLRPQPSTERTCTAAAVSQLLKELSFRSELAGEGLDHAAELVHTALDTLQNALVSRRSRVGRSTSRKGRAFSDVFDFVQLIKKVVSY